MSINDPIHPGMVADLYDIVNDIRDARMVQCRMTMDRIRATPTFYHDDELRREYQELIKEMRVLEGAL